MRKKTPDIDLCLHTHTQPPHAHLHTLIDIHNTHTIKFKRGKILLSQAIPGASVRYINFSPQRLELERPMDSMP